MVRAPAGVRDHRHNSSGGINIKRNVSQNADFRPSPSSSRNGRLFDITQQPTAILAVVARFGYGVYACLSLLLHSSVLALVLLALPDLGARRGAARRAARMFFASIGSPVKVSGPAPPETCVVVANHASYLDGLILTAALPPRFTFLIKREMVNVPLAGLILKRLGSKFVDRSNARNRRQTARDLVASAGNGDALALFPEGTFDAKPGLKPFQPGAFGAALRGARPIVPVVVLGSRAKLPAGALLPRPGPLEVKLCSPLASDRFRSAKDLMQAARVEMLEHLGEPDLAPQRIADVEAGSSEAPFDAVPADR